jgi:hypothetical protein
MQLIDIVDISRWHGNCVSTWHAALQPPISSRHKGDPHVQSLGKTVSGHRGGVSLGVAAASQSEAVTFALTQVGGFEQATSTTGTVDGGGTTATTNIDPASIYWVL